MNVPIRMLGVATTIFWIILAAFIASAAYSLKDLNFGVGEPQFTTASNRDLVLTLPLFIDNRGYYSLKSFNLTTVFSDAGGIEISRASSFLAVIPSGQNTSILHNVTMSLNGMAEHASQYLFEDANLTCQVSAGLNFAEIVPAELSINVTFPWGAPLYGFKLGEPTLSVADLSHVSAKMQLSFENHAAFDLNGNVTVRLFAGQDTLLGTSQTAINATKNTSYRGSLIFSIPASAASATNLKGHFEVYFSSPMFEYGPVVIPYG
jgi:hypothetical protein